MFFCPFCSTLLLVVPHVEGNALVCSTCRYVHSLARASPQVPRNAFGEPILTIQHSFVAHNRQPMDGEEDPAKEAAPSSSATACGTTVTPAPVVEGETSAEGGQITTIPCQNEDNPCPSTQAYFIQIQMRSADEPATVFFKCVKCGHQWRQD